MGSLKNQILISMPHMTDPYFLKSVVFICEHNKEGAMGIIINKRFQKLELEESFKNISIGDEAISSLIDDIYFGGPVMIERGIILHSSEYQTDGTIQISDDISMSSHTTILNELQNHSGIVYKLFLGHSGWTSGQLEREIENGDWLMQSTTLDFIFNADPEQMWQQAAGSLGMNVGMTTGFGGQA